MKKYTPEVRIPKTINEHRTYDNVEGNVDGRICGVNGKTSNMIANDKGSDIFRLIWFNSVAQR